MFLPLLLPIHYIFLKHLCEPDLYQCFSTFFFPRPTFWQEFALGLTFTEDSIQNSVRDIIANSKITKNNQHRSDFFYVKLELAYSI